MSRWRRLQPMRLDESHKTPICYQHGFFAWGIIMNNEILNAALKERDKLKAEMEKSPTYRRLAAIENVIAAYGGATSAEKMSKGEQILSYAKQCIAEKGGFAKMADIHQYLADHGVVVAKPALSAYLSGFREYLNPDRTKGWSIKEGR
jgi:hypothetical protein